MKLYYIGIIVMLPILLCQTVADYYWISLVGGAVFTLENSEYGNSMCPCRSYRLPINHQTANCFWGGECFESVVPISLP